MVLDADGLPSPEGDECRVRDVHGLRSRDMREGLLFVPNSGWQEGTAGENRAIADEVPLNAIGDRVYAARVRVL